MARAAPHRRRFRARAACARRATVRGTYGARSARAARCALRFRASRLRLYKQPPLRTPAYTLLRMHPSRVDFTHLRLRCALVARCARACLPARFLVAVYHISRTCQRAPCAPAFRPFWFAARLRFAAVHRALRSVHRAFARNLRALRRSFFRGACRHASGTTILRSTTIRAGVCTPFWRASFRHFCLYNI